MPSSVATSIQTLPDLERDLLTVLSLIGEPVSRSGWHKALGAAGIRETPSRLFTPGKLLAFLRRMSSIGVVEVVSPHESPAQYQLPASANMFVLELAHRAGRLDAIFDRLYGRDRTHARFGNRTDQAGSAAIRIACVREDWKTLGSAVGASLRYSSDRSYGPIILSHFGIEAREAWIVALEPQHGEAYVATALEWALRHLQVPSDAVLRAGLSSRKRESVVDAARLLVLLGRKGELAGVQAFERCAESDRLGVELIAAFLSGAYDEARKFGDLAVASIRKRRYKQLPSIEGVFYAMTCVAHNDREGAWQTALDVIGNALPAKVGYPGAYSALDVFARSVLRKDTLPQDTARELGRGVESRSPSPEWVEVLCAATVHIWLGRELGENVALGGDLETWSGPSIPVAFETLRHVFSELRDVFRGAWVVAGGITSAYRRREPWELALESLSVLGQKKSTTNSHTANDTGRVLVWELQLTQGGSIFDSADDGATNGDTAPRGGRKMGEGASDLWDPTVCYRYLPVVPRLVSKTKGGHGRAVSLDRLARSKVPEVDEHDRRLLASMVEEHCGWGRRADICFPIEALPELVGHPRIVDNDGLKLTVELGRPRIEVKHVPRHTPSEKECQKGSKKESKKGSKKAGKKGSKKWSKGGGQTAGEEAGNGLIGHTSSGIDRGGDVILRLKPPELFDHRLLVEQREPGIICIYQRTPEVEQITLALGAPEIRVPKHGFESLSRALSSFAGGNVHAVDLDLGGGDASSSFGELTAADPAPLARLIWNGRRLNVQLRVAPLGLDGPHHDPGSGATVILGQAEGVMRQTSRDLRAERVAADAVLNACPGVAALRVDDGEYVADDLEAALAVLVELERELGSARLVWPEKRRLSLRQTANVTSLSVRVHEAGHWLRCEAEIEIDETTVMGLQTLLRLREGTSRFVQVNPDEFVALTDDLQRRIDALENLGAVRSKGVTLAPVLLPALAELFEGAGRFDLNRAAKNRLAQLESASKLRPRLPKSFSGSLRDYQEDGFIWMSRLAAAGLGAVLADDMGLGKTVQTLALLCQRAKDGPALVVAPASVTHNWADETGRFAPRLRTIDLAGGDRASVLAALKPGDLLVCSYGLLAREAEELAQIEFSTIVFDEAHALKNAGTRRAKAAFSLRAGFRICLTGTPIENHLGELWSVVQAALPGLLGASAHFAKRFVKPIADGDRACAEQLRTLIRPFVLRRTKSQVLDELPERTEVTLKVTPGADERTYYEALRRNAIQHIDAPGQLGKKARMRLLAEISKLRRAAVSPHLVDAEQPPGGAKLDVLIERLVALQREGHRALVFTQFLGAMAMVRARLDNAGLSYLSLDGSTPTAERAKRIATFQDGQTDVFIMSLKAGGVGVNLTAADYVIHLDPWWNPATEDQAIGRAHRIGQTRPVTVYRLISEGSIEEKIVALHRSKRDLAEDLLSGMETAKALDLDELRALVER
ncbi:MAG: DEAD/DEAH box helicase [Nannocystaceae bacterium]